MAFTDRHLAPSAISAANPVVVTSSNHGLTAGQRVRATKFYQWPSANNTGMYQLNNRLFTVNQVTTNTFSLFDEFGNAIDGTAYTAYVTGGQFTLTGPDLNVQNLIS